MYLLIRISYHLRFAHFIPQFVLSKTIVNLIAACFICTIGMTQNLDIQGHRGARGLAPENTLPGFLKAIKLGVTTLELDVVISKDQKVVISLIVFVGKQQQVIMRDIADFLSVPMSTTTGIVDKLVDKGYIARYHSDQDRRIIKVELSKFGKETFELMETTLFRMSDAMLGDLSDKEQNQLVKLLEKVTTNLQENAHTIQPFN